MSWIGKSFVIGLFCLAVTLMQSPSAQAQTANSSLCFAGYEQSQGDLFERLARGVNFPNWSPLYDGFQPSDEMLLGLLKQGLTHLRLPIDGEQIMPAFSDEKAKQQYLKELADAIIHLQDLGFVLSLDMHPGGDFAGLHERDPKGGYDQLASGWDAITKHLKGMPAKYTDPSRLLLELLNEPTPAEDVWWQQAQKLANHIRNDWPDTWLVVGPAFFQRYEVLARAQPLNGERLIYAVHYYDPFPFTHQAISWDDRSPLKDIAFLPFPLHRKHGAVQAQIADLRQLGKEAAITEIENTTREPWTSERVANDLRKVGEWAKRHKVPVLVNEFGVLTHAVDTKSRLRWLEAVSKGAEDACLGWTHWDFSDGFGLIAYPVKVPDELVLKALLGRH